MSRMAPLIGLGVAVLLGVGFFFLLYQPLADEQEVLEAETAELVSEQQRLRNEIAALEEIRDREVELRAQLTQLEEYIPSGIAQPTIIRQLQASADAAGTQVTSVTFGQPTLVEGAPPTGDPGAALAEITVSVNVEGGYFQVVDLFRRLEVEVPRAVLLTNFNMAEGEDGYPQLTSIWTARLFAVVPVTEAAPPEPEPGEADAEGDADAEPDAEDDADAEVST